MSLLDGAWRETLPTLDEIDAHITNLQEQLAKVQAFREGVRLIRSVTETGAGAHKVSEVPAGLADRELESLSAKDRLIRVLEVAGKPLKWTDLQERVSRGPNPPTPGTMVSAYYHNTKSGDQCFLPLPDGYAGLTGRDEDWEPELELPVSEDNAKCTIRDLVREYLATHAEFTLGELQDAILARRPDALKHTIRGHLSYAKQQGEAENVGRGQWKSLLFTQPKSSDEDVMEWFRDVADSQKNLYSSEQ